MNLDEFSDGDVGIVQAERAAQRQRVQLAAANAKVKALTGELEAAEERLALVGAATAQAVPPGWLSRAKPKKSSVTVCTMLSDTHWDEVVSPGELGGVNAYDRAIAEARLQRFVGKTMDLADHYLAEHLTVDGAVLFLGGDLVSGDIHEELTETNEAPMLETVVHWSGQLAAAVEALHSHFGRLHVAGVVGNHGRRTRKPRAKGRVHDNFDWLVMQSAAQIVGDREGLSWEIPETVDLLVEVHGLRILMTHGDQVTGGGGIGGIWPPIKRLQARKQTNPISEHDLLIMGHWHQLTLASTAGLIVNGSTKGFDEYAASRAFAYEDPRQAWWVVAPGHGVTMSAPILVGDRKAEGW